MRGRRIALLMCVIVSSEWAQESALKPEHDKPDTKLQKQVEKIADEHHGKVALFAKNLNTGATVSIHADEVVQTASTIKLAALIEAFYQIKAGKKTLGDKVMLRKEDQVGGSGV